MRTLTSSTLDLGSSRWPTLDLEQTGARFVHSDTYFCHETFGRMACKSEFFSGAAAFGSEVEDGAGCRRFVKSMNTSVI